MNVELIFSIIKSSSLKLTELLSHLQFMENVSKFIPNVIHSLYTWAFLHAASLEVIKSLHIVKIQKGFHVAHNCLMG
jgi:hypothetical protein